MKHSIGFVLEKKNNRINEVRVRMRIRWSGNLAQFSIPYTVNPNKWNKDTNRCTANTTHGKSKVSANEINREIQKYEDAVGNVFRTFPKPTKEEFKNEFNSLIGKEKKKETLLLADLLDVFMQQSGAENTWSEKTFKHFNTLKNHLNNFNDKLTINITDSELVEFIQYLQTKEAYQANYKNAERGLSNRTINRYVSKIRWFLKWAHRKGYYKGDLHETFKPKLTGANDKRKVIFLKWNELLKLYDYKFDNKSLEQVRDVFCFCCFTSLRYSDVFNLKRTNIYENHIALTTQKTHEELKIDLNDFSRSILEKYKDLHEKALPVISNQKMNDYLKIIGKMLEFDEPITTVFFVGSKRYEETSPKYELLTTHCGRRTFIVNAIYLGIPAEVVMKWTGHEDYKSMKPYLEIVDDLKSSEMNKFNVRHLKK